MGLTIKRRGTAQVAQKGGRRAVIPAKPPYLLPLAKSEKGEYNRDLREYHGAYGKAGSLCEPRAEKAAGTTRVGASSPPGEFCYNG